MWLWRGGLLGILALAVGGAWHWSSSPTPPTIKTPTEKTNTNPVPETKEGDQPLELPQNSTDDFAGINRQQTAVNFVRQIEIFLKKDERKNTRTKLDEALRLFPDEFELYELLATLYLLESETEKLANLIGKIRETFPNQKATVEVLQTQFYLLQEDQESAWQHLEATADLAPDLQLYQAALAWLQNDWKTGEDILSKLRRQPDADFLDTKNKEKARRLWDTFKDFEFLTDGATAHQFAEIAKTLADLREYSLAKFFANEAIKEQVKYADAWVLRGYVLYELGQYKAALNDLQHAYALDPLRSQTHYFLALVYDFTGAWPEAALFFEKALENPSEQYEESIKWKLIELTHRLKKFDRMFELYTEVLQQDSPPHHYTRAISTAINVLKDSARAVGFTQSLIEKYPKDVLIMNLHGWALLANKQIAESEKILKAALNQDETNPRTYLNLGLLAEAKSNAQQARDYYQQSFEFGKNKPTYQAIVELSIDRHNKLVEQIGPAEKQLDRPASAP